jgi:hypothetical protein
MRLGRRSVKFVRTRFYTGPVPFDLQWIPERLQKIIDYTDQTLPPDVIEAQTAARLHWQNGGAFPELWAEHNLTQRD